MRLTLGKAKTLLARYAHNGACADNPRVLEKINEARERLMKKAANWKGKMQRFVFCTSSACLTLPREIETVEAVALCREPLRMRSQWYEMMEGGPGVLASGGTSGIRDYSRAMVDRGDGHVTFADLDAARTIKVYADVPESAGARILLQGFDSNGNRVRTYDETTSAYVDGEYVAINNTTPAVSTTVFSSLTNVQKPETNGFVRLYAFTAGDAGHSASDTVAAENQNVAPLGPGTMGWTGTSSAASWSGQDETTAYALTLTAVAINEVWEVTQIAEITGASTTPSEFVCTWDGAVGDPDAVGNVTISGEFTISGDPVTLTITFSDVPNPTAYNGETIAIRIDRTIVAEEAATAEYSLPIAVYHPDEMNPSYRRYFIPGLATKSDGTAQDAVQCVIMAKLRYLPVSQDIDLVGIEHVGALKHMLLAINMEEKGELKKALMHEEKAGLLLAEELQNYLGDAATANQGMQVQMPGLAAGDIPFAG